MRIFSTVIFTFIAFALQLNAQATLSIQGVVKKSNGSAVDDGNYSLTFKLYPVETGGSPVHSETQNVLVEGGVYSALLGTATPLTAPFNTTYYLGVSVNGTAEMTPRARLTASPYSLSLLGQDNVFPSTGNVGVGTTSPSQKLDVAGNAKIQGDLQVQGNFIVSGVFNATLNLTGLSQNIETSGGISASSISATNISGGTATLNVINAGTINAVAPISTTSTIHANSSITADATISAGANIHAGTTLSAGGNISTATGTVSGQSVNVNGKPAVNGDEALRIVSGRIGLSGNILYGSGFTCTRHPDGYYTITFNTPFVGPTHVVASCLTHRYWVHTVPSVDGATVKIEIVDGDSYEGSDFDFIAVGSR